MENNVPEKQVIEELDQIQKAEPAYCRASAFAVASERSASPNSTPYQFRFSVQAFWPAQMYSTRRFR